MGGVRRTLAAIGAALLLAAASAACGSGGERPPASPTPTPAPVSTTVATEAPSPAASPSASAVASPTPSPAPAASPSPAADDAPPLPEAVREVLAEVVALRGLEAPPNLRAATVSRSELPALVESAITEAEFRRFDEVTTLYRLLGHLRPDQDYWGVLKLALGGVVGLYDPAAKQLWVVTDGAGLDALDGWQLETLAHELMHALQDHRFDLTAMLDGALGDLDRELAARAVVEGDAEVHARLWAEGARGWRPGGARLLLVGALPQAGDVPDAVIREFIFPYQWGSVWAEAAIARGGLAAIDAALDDPPSTTAHIIHPDAIAPDWTPEAVALPPLADALGEGWRLESEGPLGEFQLLNYLLPDRGGPPRRGDARATDAAVAAAGWRGDRHAIYVNGGESVVAVRVRFADAEEAREFDATHRAAVLADAEVVTEGALTLATRADGMTVALVEPPGRDALFAIGSNAAVARAALEALLGG